MAGNPPRVAKKLIESPGEGVILRSQSWGCLTGTTLGCFTYTSKNREELCRTIWKLITTISLIILIIICMLASTVASSLF